MEVLFLDANVLYSAAHKDDSDFTLLWRLANVRLVSSLYAVGEVHRNLRKPEQEERLTWLLRSVRLVASETGRPIPEGIILPAKDVPILLAAIDAEATHLLTGDVAHFGRYYRTEIEGVLIMSPADYFRTRPL
jgi:uncharacterized protein